MRISFDLDGTIFTSSLEHAEGAMFSYLERGKVCPLRAGTRALFQALSERGWEIWFYTNSWRSRTSLGGWAINSGLHVREVVNQQIHENKCEEMGFSPTEVPEKMPEWFGIDLHVDDSSEITEQAISRGVHAILIAEGDLDWVDKVLLCADSFSGYRPQAHENPRDS